MSGRPESRGDPPAGDGRATTRESGADLAPLPDSVDRAVSAVAAGDPVLIHDAGDREDEVDLVRPAVGTTHRSVARLRNEAGGLICVAIGDAAADAMGLPFFVEAVDHPAVGGDLAYDDRSSFSLSVNHRETRTGVTDRDRATTIRALADATRPEAPPFAETFRAPGHVHLLRAAPDFAERRGHTELAVALARAAEQPPAMVVCECLDDATGEALSPAEARRLATEQDVPYVEGQQLVEAVN